MSSRPPASRLTERATAIALLTLRPYLAKGTAYDQVVRRTRTQRRRARLVKLRRTRRWDLGARAELSITAGQDRRTLSARRPARPDDAPARREAYREPKTAVRGGEPARRRRQHRNRFGRESEWRRLHAAARPRHAADRQPVALRQTPLRAGSGFRTDLNGRQLFADAGRASLHDREYGGRVRCSCESPQGPSIDLRQWRRARQSRPPGNGISSHAGRLPGCSRAA